MHSITKQWQRKHTTHAPVCSNLASLQHLDGKQHQASLLRAVDCVNRGLPCTLTDAPSAATTGTASCGCCCSTTPGCCVLALLTAPCCWAGLKPLGAARGADDGAISSVGAGLEPRLLLGASGISFHTSTTSSSTRCSSANSSRRCEVAAVLLLCVLKPSSSCALVTPAPAVAACSAGGCSTG